MSWRQLLRPGAVRIRSRSALPALALQDGVALHSEPAIFVPEATAAKERISRRRIAFWIFFAIVAIIAMIAGVLTWQIIDTVGTVNSASTPPPVVSAAMLGGSPDVQIDTAAARTAVAVSALGLTATPTPIPTSTMTVAPTSTATATTPATTVPTSTASATPVPTATATMPNVVIADASPGIDSSAPSATPRPTRTIPAASPAATETAISEADEDYDLPTEIDVPIDNLTATPATPVSVESAEVIRVEVTAAAAPTLAPTDEPTPEATVLSAIERVTNGSFEQGAEPWYLESGAGPVVVDDAADGTTVLRIPASGAYVDQSIFTIPGTSYYLAGFGRMTAGDDSGILGVVYLDAQGNRLRDLEPAPITFRSTKFSQKGMEFTPPAEVAKVKVYAYKDPGPAALEVDAISVRSIVPPFIEGGSVQAGPDLAEGSQTILIMGVDAREGEAIDGQVRPDSLMLVHLNPASSACRVLSIPRDTRTELPGYGLTKINHALAVGGIDYEVQVVSDLTGLPIDHYVLIDFSGFEDLVDAIGGITIDVPEPFTAIDGTVFQAGEQRMTGKLALSYARHRSDAEGDFGRIKRQQQVIRALIRESSGMEVLTSIRELLPAVQENLRTDLSVPAMIDMANSYRSICTEDAVTMLRLEGEIATFDDPLLQMPLSYVVVDEAEIRRKVAALLEP